MGGSRRSADVKSDQVTPNLRGAASGLSPRQRLVGTDLLLAFDAIESRLATASGYAPNDPFVSGYLAGVRVRGERLAGIGGIEALRIVFDPVTVGGARAAYGRRQFVETAGAGLPGWRP